MWVCICRGLTDTDLKKNLDNYAGQTIRTDYCGLEEFHMECSGDGTQCGKCLDVIKTDIIEPHNKIAKRVHALSDQAQTPKTTKETVKKKDQITA